MNKIDLVLLTEARYANPAETSSYIKTIEACSPTPVYGRVDIINNNQGMPVVIELELIEPELWLRHSPDAATELAVAVDKFMELN